MKKAIILHGWCSSPKEHWFQEEKAALEAHGYHVETPLLPNRFLPKENEWVKIIEGFSPDEETILIGHSLGGTTVLEYLEKSNRTVGPVVIVGAPIKFSNELGLGTDHNFKLYAESFAIEALLETCDYEDIYDWEKIKKSAKKFVLIYKDKDLRGPVIEGNILAKKLNSSLTVLEGSDHCDFLDINIINRSIL